MGVPRSVQKKIARSMAGERATTVAEAVAAQERASKATRLDDIDQKMLDLYQREQNAIDQQADIVRGVKAEIEAEATVLDEQSRMEGILSTEVEPSTFHQTRTTEEYGERLRNQLRDPTYSARTILRRYDRVEDDAYLVAEAYARHRSMIDGVLAKLRENKRWESRVKEWFGDSPWADELQFHVDKWTDPTRPNSFIQFEDAKEMGLHIGTNRAAESLISRFGIEGVMRDMAEQQEAIEIIAKTLEMPLKELEMLFGDATRRHFERVFTKGSDTTFTIWEEVEDILSDFIEAMDWPTGQGQAFINGMKDMPRPSTTPLFFRGKNGLLLTDEGNFKPATVANQLYDIFPDSVREIDDAMAKIGQQAKTKALQEFIESKGFDHIVYHNRVEDKGLLSIINWNPDLQRSPWDPEFTRNSPTEAANIAASYVLAMLGFGGAGASLRDTE